MTPFDAHLDLLREILSERNPLTYGELAGEVVSRAGKKNVKTSALLVVRLAIAAIANLEPVAIAFPDVPKILVLLADGRFKLKT